MHHGTPSSLNNQAESPRLTEGAFQVYKVLKGSLGNMLEFFVCRSLQYVLELKGFFSMLHL